MGAHEAEHQHFYPLKQNLLQQNPFVYVQTLLESQDSLLNPLSPPPTSRMHGTGIPGETWSCLTLWPCTLSLGTDGDLKLQLDTLPRGLGSGSAPQALRLHV